MFAQVHKSGKGSRWSGGKEHDRSNDGKEGYAVICAGYNGSETNGTRCIRP